MKLGLGLYRHMLDADHFRFARQSGATHIVAHLVDYFPDRSGGSASDDLEPHTPKSPALDDGERHDTIMVNLLKRKQLRS